MQLRACSALLGSSIKVLNLQENNIGDAGAAEIAKALPGSSAECVHDRRCCVIVVASHAEVDA